MSWQLSNEELIQKIALGEDSHLELKQLVFRGDSDRPSDPRPDGLADEIAAFANSRDGGVLVLGVDDGTRRILGIPRARLAAVQQWLDGIVNDRIKGPPRLVSVIFEAEDDSGQQKALIRLNIPPSIEVHRSPGGHFDRSVHGKRPMTQEALARLLQQRSQVGLIRFEEQIVHTATFADLDPQLCERYLVAGQGAPEVQMRRLHLVREHSGLIRPTVLGVLLCAREPRHWVRGAWVQAVAHRGLENDPADQVDAADFTGPVDAQILDSLAFVRKNMKVAARKEPERVDVPQFAERAVFEAIVNAVAHRDYSMTAMPVRVFLYADRLEIVSPGALPNSMTLESMRSLSLPRNELLASMFARYIPVPESYQARVERRTLMDVRGAGVEIIEKSTLEHSGLPVHYEQVDRLALRLIIPAADPMRVPSE